MFFSGALFDGRSIDFSDLRVKRLFAEMKKACQGFP
jgi:hypothetical protein